LPLAQTRKDIKDAIDGVRAGKDQLSEEGKAHCNDWFKEREDYLQTA
jgi:hypothetical protein